MRFDPIYSEVEYEKEEVASNSSNWRDYESISQAKEICGYLFRDLDQRQLSLMLRSRRRGRGRFLRTRGLARRLCFGADDCV